MVVLVLNTLYGSVCATKVLLRCCRASQWAPVISSTECNRSAAVYSLNRVRTDTACCADALCSMSQVECSDVIVVNKVDLIDTDQQKLLQDIVQALAPRAKVISTSFGKVPLAATLGTLTL
jgi:G3E family GTPase